MNSNKKSDLTSEEIKQAKQLTVWTVWYEDKFGWGPDRDPAILIHTFLSKEEADAYALSKGGASDIHAGKFDGYEVEKDNLYSLSYLSIMPKEEVQGLIKEARKRELLP